MKNRYLSYNAGLKGKYSILDLTLSSYFDICSIRNVCLVSTESGLISYTLYEQYALYPRKHSAVITIADSNKFFTLRLLT